MHPTCGKVGRQSTSSEYNDFSLSPPANGLVQEEAPVRHVNMALRLLHIVTSKCMDRLESGFKQMLMSAYCHGLLSERRVGLLFKYLPWLRGA